MKSIRRARRRALLQLPLPGFELPTLVPATGDRRFACVVCGEPLAEVDLPDGRRWTVDLLAMQGRRQHKAVLCRRHYEAAEGRPPG